MRTGAHTLTCAQSHAYTNPGAHAHTLLPTAMRPLRTGGKPHQGDRPGNGCERDLRVCLTVQGQSASCKGSRLHLGSPARALHALEQDRVRQGFLGEPWRRGPWGSHFVRSLPKPDQVYGHLSCVELGVQAPWGVRGSLWAIWTHVPPEAGGPRPCSAAPPAPQHQRRHNPHCVSA